MDETHKYNLGETVAIPRRDKEKLGIIERILIKEELEINNEERKHIRNVEYGVRPEAISVFTYDEKSLEPSERQLHRDAFRVQNGQVILNNNKEYIVEDARDKTHSAPGARMGLEDSWEVWHVKARELSDGNYNPNGKLIEFDQNKDEPIDIVKEMRLKKNYE
ncbi:MAG: hypothetical protein WDZ69_02570 [Candidatus Pacearchaeota archaeon]